MSTTPLLLPSYEATGNLGDAVQYLALERLLASKHPLIPCLRKRFASLPDHPQVAVINGFWDANYGANIPIPSQKNIKWLFAGIHIGDLSPAYFSWLKTSKYLVGTRDPASHEAIRTQCDSKFIGCSTMTFPRFSGPRKGIYLVDAEQEARAFPTATKLSHHIPSSLSWIEQKNRATEYLNHYRTAELVVTSKLHVAVPCLAFGTPVLIPNPSPDKYRFSLLDALGFKYSRENVIDLSSFSSIFQSHLEEGLQTITQK